MNSKLKRAHGNWVVGDRFWDREEDLALFTRRIDEGAHLLLVAQRRMGKTSVMREAARRLAARYLCVFVDLQKAAGAPDAVVELSLAMHEHRPLWNRAKQVFSNILNKVEEVKLRDLGIRLRASLTAGNWAEKADQLLAILAAADKPVLLLLDEVAIAVNRMLKGEDFTITPERRAQVDEFMSWLRKSCTKHQGKVRVVISGSIGLEPILHQAHLSATINNLEPFELKAWDEATAVGCLEALANEYGVQFEDGVPAEMVRQLGCCIPHHVEMFFTHVYDRCVRRGSMVCSTGDIAEVYQSEMLGTRGHVELTHYEERLKQVLGDEVLPLGLEMLTEAAVTGHLGAEALAALQKDYTLAGRTVADVQKQILWVLEHEGYLKPGSQGYVFVSKLLRDWWENRHRLFFTAVSKRGR